MKRVYSLAFIVLLTVISVRAQFLGSIKFDPGSLTTPKMEADSTVMLEKSIKSGLFLSKQSFRVCDKATGQLFGLNGHQEFGVSYTLGVKIPGGYCLTDRAVRPYRYDAKFGKYRDGYDPVMYQSVYRELTDTAGFDSLVIINLTALCDSSLYVGRTDIFTDKSFITDTAAGRKDGWIIWVTADVAESPKENIDMVVSRITLDADRDCRTETVAPSVSEGKVLIGGIYVVPVIPSVGVVQYKLCGVLVMTGDRWSVVFPFIGGDSASLKSSISAEEDMELTPVEQPEYADKKKNKKKKRK